MKKTIRFTFLVSISLFVSVLLHSCCTEEWMIVGSGNLTMEGTLDDNNQVSTSFNLLNQFEADLVSGGYSDFSLINSALATSCEYGFRNKVDMSTLSLTLDQDFTLGNEVIAAGTNLINLSQFSAFLDSTIGGVFIDIVPTFFTDATLNKGDHTFVLKADVDDGLKIESSLTLDFNF